MIRGKMGAAAAEMGAAAAEMEAGAQSAVARDIAVAVALVRMMETLGLRWPSQSSLLCW